eukprot:scaffold308533_cov60-Attheya_sp.AAC.3
MEEAANFQEGGEFLLPYNFIAVHGGSQAVYQHALHLEFTSHNMSSAPWNNWPMETYPTKSPPSPWTSSTCSIKCPDDDAATTSCAPISPPYYPFSTTCISPWPQKYGLPCPTARRTVSSCV